MSATCAALCTPSGQPPPAVRRLTDVVNAADLDIGDKTCGGYPAFNVSAVLDARADAQLRRDVEDLASWGVDALKVDGCNADPVSAATVGLGCHPCCRALAETVAATEPHAPDLSEARPRSERHRPTHPLRLLLAGCVGTAGRLQTTFPAGLAFTPWRCVAVYVGFASGESTLDYEAFARTCNLWRVYNDIEASFDNVRGIINYFRTANYTAVRRDRDIHARARIGAAFPKDSAQAMVVHRASRLAVAARTLACPRRTMPRSREPRGQGRSMMPASPRLVSVRETSFRSVHKPRLLRYRHDRRRWAGPEPRAIGAADGNVGHMVRATHAIRRPGVDHCGLQSGASEPGGDR